MIENHITRAHGHPWDAVVRPGFDLLEAIADTEEELTAFVTKAKAKFWQVWLQGQSVNNETNVLEKYAVVMFKPCGIDAAWSDSPENPHPGIILVKGD